MKPTLVLPLDGSACARAALPHALAMARWTSSRVQLVGVAEPWLTGDPLPEPVESVELLVEHLEQARRELEEAGLEVEVVARSGIPAEEILKVARPAAMVVMSSHGRTGYGRWLLGGVTARVLREAACPVLVTRAHPARPFEGRYRRILVPCDGSEYSALALPAACSLARQYGSQLCLLRVVDLPAWLKSWPGDPATLMARAEEECVQALGPDATGMIETAVGHPVERILEVAEGGFDLIVMATHGQRWGRRRGLGSTAERVVQHALCPVLLIRSKEENQA